MITFEKKYSCDLYIIRIIIAKTKLNDKMIKGCDFSKKKTTFNDDSTFFGGKITKR